MCQSLFSAYRPAVLAILLTASRADAAVTANPISFNNQIQPILSEDCYHCHGPDSAPKRLESEHLLTIFNGAVRLPDDYYQKNKVPIPGATGTLPSCSESYPGRCRLGGCSRWT